MNTRRKTIAILQEFNRLSENEDTLPKAVALVNAYLTRTDLIIDATETNISALKTVKEISENLLKANENARIDSKTGLPNEREFVDLLTHRICEMGRHPDDELDVAILYLDMDGFKALNDALGHHIGDEALKAIGERLTRRLRCTDTVARLHGDEFAILIPYSDNHPFNEWKTRKVINEALKGLVYWHDNTTPYPICASIGCKTITSENVGTHHTRQDAEHFMKMADEAMYKDKWGDVPKNKRNEKSTPHAPKFQRLATARAAALEKGPPDTKAQASLAFNSRPKDEGPPCCVPK